MGKKIFIPFIITAVILVAGVLALRNLPTQPTANPESAPSKQPYLVRPAEDQIHHNLSGVGDKPQETPAPSGESELTTPATPSIAERVTLALEAMDRKAYDKAGDFLKQALAGTTDPDERIRLGQMLYECLIRTYDYQEALVLGRDLLTLNPTPDEQLLITQQLAALLFRMGRSDEAENLLQETIANEQNEVARDQLEAQLRGFWRHTEGRTDEVISELTVLLEENPDDKMALQALGDILLKSRQDYESALPIFERIAELDPTDPTTQSTLLGLYRRNQNFEGMRKIYELQLDQSQQDDPTLHLSIAQTELLAGRGDDAVEYAEAHLAGEDAGPFELQMLSTIYDQAGRDFEAIAALDDAIAKTTNGQHRVSMQFQKADMLIWDKEFSEAEALLRSIAETAGDDRQVKTRAISAIIRIYEMQGKLLELKFLGD